MSFNKKNASNSSLHCQLIYISNKRETISDSSSTSAEWNASRQWRVTLASSGLSRRPSRELFHRQGEVFNALD